jgi:hypothetical protein
MFISVVVAMDKQQINTHYHVEVVSARCG